MGVPEPVAANQLLAVDVAVVGAGPTGLTAALCAAEAGWQVAVIAPRAAIDPRTTALLSPAIGLLTSLGVWERVAHEAAPLATMRIIDATDRLPRAPEITFDAHEIGREQFGFNIPNDVLNAALADRLAETGVIWVDALADDVMLDGTPTVVAGERRVEAQLVVGADGSESVVREAAGIGVRRWSYNQSALVTVLAHERPHGSVSTEFHTAAGPFTLVPLPGDRSSLVWVGRPDDVERLAALDPGPLAREVERRAHTILGRMAIDGPRGVIAMRGMVARRFGEGSVVLVGEAGHRFPPIGAQGLNLGMADAAELGKILAAAHRMRTLDGVAERYDRARRIDVNVRTLGVDALNRSLLSNALPVSFARALGLAAARRVGPLRKALMQAGLGAR